MTHPARRLIENIWSNRPRAIFRREWWLTCFIVTGVTLWLANSQLLNAADNLLYDRFLSLSTHQIDNRLLMVTIDDRSIEALGSWPWSREVHAKLLNTLHEAQPKGVLLNVLFTEADTTHPERDEALANSMHGMRVYLPLLIEDKGDLVPRRYILPTPALAGAAAGIGHINLSPDADGTARNVFLRESAEYSWWSHVALLMAESSGSTKLLTDFITPGMRNPATQNNSQSASLALRDYKIGISFVGGQARVPQVSYIDVLRGDVPLELLQGRFVLIGATTRALGTVLPTPTSSAYGGMSGLEIHANVLNSLLQKRSITSVSSVTCMLFASLPIFLLMLLFLIGSTRYDLPITLGLSGLVLLACFIGLNLLHIWTPPVATLLGIWLAYLLWSWRSLEATQKYFSEQLSKLEFTPFILPESFKFEPTKASSTVDKNIYRLKRAIAQMQDLQSFVAQSLNCLPVAVCVCSVDKRIVLANQQANHLFSPLFEQKKFQQPSSATRLDGKTIENVLNYFASTTPDSPSLIDVENLKLSTLELKDPLGRSYRIESTPILPVLGHAPLGWLFAFVDLTAVRSAEQQRSDMLNFLSHDLRKPQSAILALLTLQEEAQSATSPENFYNLVASNVHRTLALADGFIQLTRAEISAYTFGFVDYSDLILDACDQVWPQAKIKNISIEKELPEDEMSLWADRSQVIRALVNLLENAVNYSPENSTVCFVLRKSTDQRYGVLNIQDKGIGIAKADMPNLFKPFSHFSNHSSGATFKKGHGLGLAQARVSIERHGGSITCQSEINFGSTFTVSLPLYRDQG